MILARLLRRWKRAKKYRNRDGNRHIVRIRFAPLHDGCSHLIGALMRHVLALPATLLLCTPAFADTNADRLQEISHFFANANVVSGPTLVDCTLSAGTKASCFSITVKAEPQDYTPGPWCPTSVEPVNASLATRLLVARA